jgi:hypothetical protein
MCSLISGSREIALGGGHIQFFNMPRSNVNDFIDVLERAPTKGNRA